MGKRRFGGKVTNIPGKGLTWTESAPTVPYPSIDGELLPSYVPPEVARRVMQEFWDILGIPAWKRKEAMRRAWARVKRR